jgi:hypothetical protein
MNDEGNVKSEELVTEAAVREEIHSKAVRAGKRTYFFDVKATRRNDYYLTITESKKRFNRDGKFFYEKHKLFLYKEDFEKFSRGLEEVIEFIETGKKAPEPDPEVEEIIAKPEGLASVEFEDLGDPDETKEEI